MNGSNEILAQLVDRFYLLTINIGRTKNRFVLFTKVLGLLCDGVPPPFLQNSYGARMICKLLLLICQAFLNLTKLFHRLSSTLLQTINATDDIRTRRSQKFNHVVKIGNTVVQLFPILSKLLLTFPFY
jgi:hypothetical protein